MYEWLLLKVTLPKISFTQNLDICILTLMKLPIWVSLEAIVFALILDTVLVQLGALGGSDGNRDMWRQWDSYPVCLTQSPCSFHHSMVPFSTEEALYWVHVEWSHYSRKTSKFLMIHPWNYRIPVLLLILSTSYSAWHTKILNKYLLN